MNAPVQRQAAAFQELLGLQSLPHTGREARDASQRLADVIAASCLPPPQLSRLVAEHLAGLPPLRPRFVDISTGLRLRYLEWGSCGDVVLLLHDHGEAAEIWAPIGPALADRGYHVIALDLRGHGESARSREGRYGADMLAEDVQAFILARDLYVAPVAVVGCGMGAAAGLALAQHSPFLAGALLAAEFALPVADIRALRAQGGDGGAAGAPETASGPAGGQALSSKALLPWWGFKAGQAGCFAGVEHCAAFLAHPLANLAPRLVLPLARVARQSMAAAQASTVGSRNTVAGSCGSLGPAAEPAADAQAEVPFSQLLARSARPLRGAVASACSLLRLPSDACGRGGAWDGVEPDSALQPRMDPGFLFSFDAAALLAGLPALRCHLLLLHGGGGGSWVEPADAEGMAGLAAQGGAASAAVAAIPDAGHCLAADHPDQLLKQIIAFLEGPAIRCFDRQSLVAAAADRATAKAGSGAVTGIACARRPEMLGLRPLPQYASLEEAKKALGPRTIPTPSAIEAELCRLRLEEGRAADDASSDEEGGGRSTALAKDPADYFGFAG